MSEMSIRKPIFEQKCPQCGGAVRFDPSIGQTKCDFCGSILTIDDFTGPDIQVKREDRDRALETMQPLPVYNCLSCGAEVIAPPMAGALTCPYCQNHIVLSQQFSGTIRPDGILPFKITPDKIPSAVRKYYTGNPFVPRKLFSKASIGEVTGIYVPFWVFDCDVYGDISFSAAKVGAVTSNGDYQTTRMDHYRLNRNVQMSFRNLAVDASRKMSDALMDSLQPFHFEEVKPFDVRYMAGYVADRFDETSEEGKAKTDRRVIRTAADVARQKTVDKKYSTAVQRSNHLQAVIRKDRYYLLPVYVLNVEFDGKPYQFAMNGQTGKVVGKLPQTDEGERRYYWTRFGMGFGIAAAIFAILLAIF